MKECSERATSPRLANYEIQGVFREVEIFSFLLTSHQFEASRSFNRGGQPTLS